jgi:hypothetical protein
VTPLFAISDVVWQAIIAGVVTVVLTYMAQRGKKATEDTGKATKDAVLETAKVAAVKVEEVKETAKVAAVKVDEVKVALKENADITVEKLDSIVKTGEANARVGQMTHALVNSAMLEQKRMYAVKCEAMASKTGDQVDVVEAKAAREAYDEHRRKQESMESNVAMAAAIVSESKK